MLDGTSIAVAGREVERGETRSVHEASIDQAEAFKDIGPVNARDEVHAGNDIADGDVGGTLTLLSPLYQLIDGGALQTDSTLQPAHHGVSARIDTAQALGQLGDERCRQRCLALRQGGGVQGVMLAFGNQPLTCQGVGVIACRLFIDDLLGKPAKVLDQHDAQRDGHRP